MRPFSPVPFCRALMSGGGICLLLWAIPALCLPVQTPPAASPIGIVVEAVAPGSAAAKAGLQMGDVLLWAGGRPLQSTFDLQAALENVLNAPDVVVKGLRGSQTLELKLPANAPDVQVRPTLSPELLSLYRAGESEARAGHAEAAITSWQKAAEIMEKAGDKARAGWLHGRMGEAYYHAQLWKQTQLQQERAWQMLEHGNDVAAQICVLRAIAVACYNQGNYTSAAVNSEKAAALDVKDGHPLWEIVELGNNGLIADNQRKPALAEQYFQKALAMQQRHFPDSLEAGRLFYHLAKVASDQRQILKFRSYLLSALAIFHKHLPDSEEETEVNINLSSIAQAFNNLAEAKTYLENALTIHLKRDPNSPFTALCFLDLGKIAQGQGLWKEAEVSLNKALAIYQKQKPDSPAVADIYNMLGGIAADQSNFNAAQKYYKQAYAIRSIQTPDAPEFASILGNMGNIAFSQSDLTEARRYTEQARDIFSKRAPDSLEMAVCLGNLGMILFQQGDMETAERLLQQSYELNKKILPLDALPIAENLKRMGVVADEQGDLPRASEYFQKSFDIYKAKAPGTPQFADCLSNLALIFYQQSNWSEARKNIQRALDIYTVVNPLSPAIPSLLINLSMVAIAQNDFAGATRYTQQALELVRTQTPNSVKMAACFSNFGQIAYQQQDLKKAEDYYRQAVNILHLKMPGSNEEAILLADLGHIYLQQHQSTQALPVLTQSAEILEAQRQHIPDPETRALFLQQHASPFFDLMQAQLEQKQPEQAYETLERDRARTLVELLHERGPRVQIALQADVPAAELRKQQQISQARAAASHRLLHLDTERDKDEIKNVSAQITSLDVQQRELDAAIRRTSPHYAALRYPQALTVAKAQQTLDEGTLQLAYAVGDKQSYLFALTKSSLNVYTLSIDRQTLQEEVGKLRQALHQPDTVYQPTAQQLYKQLLWPAQSEIAASRRLLICPDGPLHELPFAALITSPEGAATDTFLVESKPLHVVVSLSLYRELRQQPTVHSGPLLAFADPDYTALNAAAQTTGSPQAARRMGEKGLHLGPLAETQQQITELQALYGARVRAYTGKQATIAALKQQGTSAAIVHLACHGLLNSADPLASALVLSSGGKGDDGLLFAYDILGMRLPADLVMLSACDTGLGKQTDFEGVIGLTRALQYAGARSVGVTLWSVDMIGTNALMAQFYRAYPQSRTKDEALQQAQIAMLHDRAHTEWHHPFYWAAFEIIGDYK